ncbi:hypothetical protein CHS0354_040754 [Potamilus streckersoni]|uniref:Sulfatase N-terminal domain-containing protein n=1 Tax=Potamilus streckersoni TaxID=2493646 RepID=A0AAE0SL12_9BIVA|nr:hypothetical protein CHS0354_040754 [Potamilus streckersoni]
MTGRNILFLAVWLQSVLHAQLRRPPHIVLIVADDLGWNDVGWHNSQMYTPNLNKLAQNGVILNSSYVQPVCTPTRSSLLTGYYPYHVGLQHNVLHSSRPGHLYKNFTLLSQKLKELEYVTHMVGKWHLGFCNWNYTPTYRGFDSFLGMYSGAEDYYTHVTGYSPHSGYDFRFNKSVYYEVKGEYSANVFARRAIDIINSVNPKKESLFLYVPFQSVHEPVQVPKKYEDIYSHIQNKTRRTYCGMVSALDEAIGNITDALTHRGYMDNLLLIFTSDNGGPVNHGANNWPLRGSKNTLWEGGTKGAAFVYSKTLLKKTKYVNTEMFHVVDWFPTLLSVAGGRSDPGLDGIDQWPTIQSGAPSKRSNFVYNIDEIMKNAAIRVGDYKLIEGKPGTHNGWYPAPNNHRKHFRNQTTFHDIGALEYQLFNIKSDPTEHFNLAKKLPDVLKKLQLYLQEFKKTLVPAFYPPGDPKSNPKYYNGTWSPGWC